MLSYSSAQGADPGEYIVQLWRENLSLFSYFAPADENRKANLEILYSFSSQRMNSTISAFRLCVPYCRLLLRFSR